MSTCKCANKLLCLLQNEAEGFRGITYFYDRPDVMSKYTVRIEGEKAKVPVMLSNGNLQESGDLEGGRYIMTFVHWEAESCTACPNLKSAYASLQSMLSIRRSMGPLLLIRPAYFFPTVPFDSSLFYVMWYTKDTAILNIMIHASDM